MAGGERDDGYIERWVRKQGRSERGGGRALSSWNALHWGSGEFTISIILNLDVRTCICAAQCNCSVCVSCV